MQSDIKTNVNASINHGTYSNVTTTGDWNRAFQTRSFQELIRQKRSFIVPATIFFFVFYFILPILTAYTTVLNGKAVGVINWAYMYAFAQFVMTWGLCHLYMKKAKRFDELVNSVKQEITAKGGKAE
ncbi:DUF485 domain-containing protein [Effusibacillus dendaii]|uniref:DUF485 domain-containing protein n=1 Tax=Effusibacillus dendaii TaxID=2743772 RepID=A0A7I8DE78_9BACL|nr:DUF485 domain-containing protein [Effusibacillus dendaii]BCJ87259.1 hypothetical protein skT53_22440 [Effusibacillus dendaii]